MTSLTALDRCDRCGAQAFTLYVLGASSLLFCAHHDREHGDALRSQGATLVVDETAALTSAPASGTTA
jgi:hypothetical protein